jgi:hypothetical protein
MSRTPYSPFVLKATAPVPWKAGRVVRVVVLGRLRRQVSKSDLKGRD